MTPGTLFNSLLFNSHFAHRMTQIRRESQIDEIS